MTNNNNVFTLTGLSVGTTRLRLMSKVNPEIYKDVTITVPNVSVQSVELD
ncbi:hypothetical protein [Bacillus sp. JJ722]